MKTKINERLETLFAEFQSGGGDPLSEPVPAPLLDAKRRAMMDWRSFPTNHPFYAEGAQMEGSIAAIMGGLYDSIDFNDDVRLWGVSPENLAFLEPIN